MNWIHYSPNNKFNNNSYECILIALIFSSLTNHSSHTFIFLSHQVQDDERIAEITANNQYLRREINSLKKGAHLFQASKCSVCKLPLELPVVHFVCGHSYHKACLGGHEGCMQCAFKLKQNQVRRMMNRPFLRVADPPSEEEFFNAVGEGKGER